jgi:hypothetical protein
MSSFDGSTSFQEQLIILRQRGLDKYLSRDLPIFKSKFERLQQLLELPANNDNYNEAYQLLYFIFDAIPIMYNRLIDVDIFRAQPNKPNELFITQQRISYNNDLTKISPGKFNAWYESMFYGCLPYKPSVEKDYLPPSAVAALECCKDLTNINTEFLLKDITIGRWQIQSELNVVNLCFDEVHLGNNPELRDVNSKYLNTLLEVYNSSAGDFVKNIFEYFSTLCRTGTNEKAYYVLTALYSALRDYYKTECSVFVDGLISSSAASEGRGLNIVLTPDAVKKNLILNAVMMFRFFLVMPEARTYVSYPCSEMIENYLNVKDFQYNFKKHSEIPERFLLRMKIKENHSE